MKSFKLFLEAEKRKKIDAKYNGIKTIYYEIPSAMISQGKHSYPPDNTPSAMVSQGKHSEPKRLKEDWYNNKSLKTINNDANPHLGPTPEHVSEGLHAHYPHGDLNDNQKEALREYTGSSSELNNTLLDSHRNKERAPPRVGRTSTAHMDSALNKHELPHPLTVFSGVKFHPDKLASQTPTREIHLPAYTSTSIKPSVTEEFASTQFDDDGEGAKHVLKFHLQPGQKGFYIGNHSELGHEHEFILPRNTRIKLGEKPDTSTRDSQDRPIHIWDAHVVPHDPDDPHRRVLPDLTQAEHFDKLMKPDGTGFQKAGSTYPEEVKSHHIDKALEHSSEWVRAAAARHPNASPEQIDRALNDPSEHVKYNAVENPNASKANLDKAMESPDKLMKSAVLSNPNATNDHFVKGMADKDVYNSVEYNLNKDHLAHALDHRFSNNPDHEQASLNVLNNGHYRVNSEHIETALSHPNPKIRVAAYKNFRHKMSEGQVERIKNDTHPDVKAELRET